jgi:hypothetical protein
LNENKNKITLSSSNVEQNSGYAPPRTKEFKALDTCCRINLHSRRYRLADTDGISGKAAIDGLVLGGLLQNDSPKEVKEVSYSQEKIGKNEQEETVITITITKKGCVV